MNHNGIASKMLKELSKKFSSANKYRNYIISIAIILTSMLLTIVFTTVFSLKSFLLQQSLREIGTCAEASYKSITNDEYEKLVESGMLNDSSYTIYIGNGAESIFSNHIVEFRYTDEKAAQWNFCELKSGHFPKEKNEIVVDDLFMKYIGSDYQIGDIVSVLIEIDHQTIPYEFVVSGIYVGNNVTGASMEYVSKAFVDEIIDEVDLSEDSTCGKIDMFFQFDEVDDVFEYLSMIWKECGLKGTPSIGVNWVLQNSGLSVSSIAVIIVLLIIIMIAGYLMIYNIFYISIVNDMQFYGRLKLIGMQNNQVRSLLIRQIVNISIISIPIGMLFGWCIGTKSLPILLNMMNISSNNIKTFYPMIFVYSLLFVLMTILISTRKPLKLLRTIQPINTVKYLGDIKVTKARKANSKFSLATFAYRNVCRNKKKTILIVSSLTFVMILFVISSNLVNSVNFRLFFENAIPNDIYISTTAFFDESEVQYINDDFVDACRSLRGVNNVSRYGMRTSLHFLSDKAKSELRNAYESKLFKHDEINEDIESILNMPEPTASEIRYFYEDEELQKLSVVEGKVDYKKLVQDNYVIICNRIGETDGVNIYHAGDKIILYDWNKNTTAEKSDEGTVEYHNLVEKEYTVMAVVEASESVMNYNNGYMLHTIFPIDKAKEDDEVLVYSIGLDVSNIQGTTLEIDKLADTYNLDISYITLEEKKKEYTNLRLIFVLLAGGITFVIGIMSIINFLNQCITGVIERSKELKTLHSIGMTDKQIVTMLERENSYILLFSLGIGYILGTVISSIVFYNLKPYLKWLEYKSIIWPIIVLVIIMYVMIKGLTGKIYHYLEKSHISNSYQAK